MRVLAPESFSLSDANIVAPISMARITTGQNATASLRLFTDVFPPHVKSLTNDVTFLLTTNLYLNNGQETAADLNRRLLQNNLSFRSSLKKALDASAQRTDMAVPIYPQSFACMEWINVLTSNPAAFQTHLQRLVALHKKDPVFAALVSKDITGFHRSEGPDTVSFILEEIAGTHMLYMGQAEMHKHLSPKDRSEIVITYPGDILKSMPYGLDKLQPNNADLPRMLFVGTGAKGVEHVYELQKSPQHHRAQRIDLTNG